MRILDVEAEAAFANAYYAEFLAGNQGSSRIIIQEAMVTITDSSGKQLASFTTPGAGEAEPLASGTPGYGPVEFEIVDPATIAALRAQLGPFEKTSIVTHTQAEGTTLEGANVESNVFEPGITVCSGCLTSFDTDPSLSPQPNCYGPAPSATGGTAPCNYGQDVAFDCHDCSESSKFCECAQSSCSSP